MYKCYFEGEGNVHRIFKDKNISNIAARLYMYLLDSIGKDDVLDDDIVKEELNISLPTLTRAKRNLKQNRYIRIVRLSRTEYEVILK